MKKKYTPPKPDNGDTAYLATKGILSFLPAAPELFEWFVTPPMEKKLDAWREQVGEALRQLEENKGVDLAVLQSDHRFISIVMQATTIAMRNYQEEKLTALHNAIMNSTNVDNIKEDLQFVFIRFIDELTPSHLMLLSFFVKHKRAIANEESYSGLYNWFNSIHPNTLSNEIFRLMCNDLTTRGLVRISPDLKDYDDIYQDSSLLLEETNDNLPRVIVTKVAEQFLMFISKNKSAVT